MKIIFRHLLILVLVSTAWSHSPDHFYKLMEPIHASGTGAPGVTGSSLTGAYAFKTNDYEYIEGESYDPNNGPYEFWSMNFGATQSLRKFTLGVNGSGWFDHFDGYSWTSFYNGFGDYVDSDVSNAGINNLVGTSIIYATESDLGRVASGDPDFSTGICSVAIGGSLRTGSFILNPAALTFNGVAYEPGQLALVTSIDGADFQTHRKVVLLCDLRQIGEYTDRQPDYDTGQDGLGNQTPVYGAYNQTDWTDTFYPLVTGHMILDTIPEASSAIYFNYGRQAVWAPDSSAIYFAGFTVNPSYNENDPCDFKYYNGIWKFDFADNELKWIKREYTRENRMYYCEMATVHTSLRDFTDGAENGVQILFASETENVGGISCIVDNNQVNPTLYSVLDANVYAAAIEKDVSLIDIKNIVVDPNGNIYFYNTGNAIYVKPASGYLYRGSYALYKYDTAGRLYSVSNRGHHMNFHFSNGVSESGSTGAMGAFQHYTNLFGKEMITFRSTPLRVPCGLKIFESLDFNHDNEVDIVDLRIFRDQRLNNDRWLDPIYSDDPNYSSHPDLMPGIFDANSNYINCDISGNIMYRCVLIDDDTGLPVPDELVGTLPPGNYSIEKNKLYFQEKAVTDADAQLLYQFIPAGDANLDGNVNLIDYAAFAANYTVSNFIKGDFSGDGNIDIEDLALLSSSWLNSYNLYDFARLAKNYNTSIPAGDIKDFSQGDFDFDGDVDSADLRLLTSFWLK